MHVQIPDTIDLALEDDQSVSFVLVDARIKDKETAWQAELLARAQLCASFVDSESFRQAFPSADPTRSRVRILSRNAPTEMIRNLAEVESTGGLKLPVSFRHCEHLTPQRQPPKKPEPVEQPPSSPQTKFTLSVLQDDVEGAQEAIRAGADVNELIMGKTMPVEGAILNGSAQMVDLLLSHGAKFPDAAADGRLYWAYAKAKGNQQVVDVLLEHGVRPNLVARIMRWILRVMFLFKGKSETGL